MTPRDEIARQVVEYVRTLGHAVFESTTQQWLQLELTMAQLKALFVLATAAPVSVSALAQKLDVHLSAASHIADRLVQLGLAERYEDPDDRRRTFVQLSAQGSALVAELQQGRRERFSIWLASLRDDDLAALHQGLRALAESLTAARR